MKVLIIIVCGILFVLSPAILTFCYVIIDNKIREYKENKNYKIRQNCFWKIGIDGDIYCTNYNKFISPEKCFKCGNFKK